MSLVYVQLACERVSFISSWNGIMTGVNKRYIVGISDEHYLNINSKVRGCAEKNTRSERACHVPHNPKPTMTRGAAAKQENTGTCSCYDMNG